MVHTPHSVKVKYPSIVAALDARLRPAAGITRIYKCDRCGCWHGTSSQRLSLAEQFADAEVRKILGIRQTRY